MLLRYLKGKDGQLIACNCLFETLVNEYDTLSLQFYINITKFKVRNIAHRHPDLAILEVATLTWTLRPKLQALREQSSTASPSGKNRL